MPYVDVAAPHAGSAEVLYTGMWDEPAGTIARTIPRRLVGQANIACFALTGTVFANSVALAQGMLITNIGFLTGTTAAVGPTHLWFGLLDQNMNVLGVTADQGSAAIAASTWFSLALTVRVQIQYTGLYYVAVSSSAATTAPTGAGAGVGTGVVGTIPSPVLCGTAGTQAAPPAIGAQLNSGTVTVNGNAAFAAWLS